MKLNKKILNVIKSLKELLGEEAVYENELLKHHTSFKIGGPCYALVEPESVDELTKIVQLFYNFKAPFYLIGNGTNLLVKDDGIKAFIIKLSKKFSQVIREKDKLTVLAGMSLSSLNRYAIKNGLSGLEFSYGIPGSVGGAIYMNAGAYGGQISDVVKEVKVLHKNRILTFDKNNLKFAYRSSVFQKNKNYIIVSVMFALKPADKEDVKLLAETVLNKRKQNHPNEPSAGSVFKRHKDLIASKVIDELGLKGYSVGGAKVSEKHAGFIINYNNATCEDVLKLIKHVQKNVYKKHKKRLELEVKVLGD